MSITASEAAKRLDGNEYTKEGSCELWAEMKAAGLVAVYGASDDLMEIEGAISEEVGAYRGATVYLTPAGLLQNDCEDECCPYFGKACEAAATIKAFRDREGFTFVYETTIPHETFTIYEDGQPYCRGIVFALSDVPSPLSTGR